MASRSTSRARACSCFIAAASLPNFPGADRFRLLTTWCPRANGFQLLTTCGGSLKV